MHHRKLPAIRYYMQLTKVILKYYHVAIPLPPITRLHCPTLISIDEDDLTGKPKSQLSLLLKSRKGFRRTSQKNINSFGTDPSWLHPILLPSIFKTLFALYSEHHREDNKRLCEKMTGLNTLSDEELCRAVGIRR